MLHVTALPTGLVSVRCERMKRQREDPNSYLGGDIVASFEDPESDNEGKKKLTKAERNEARKAANKMWKTTDRKVGSGKDPNPRHTVYYQSQIPDLRDPEEWVKFQNALIDPLPVTFRIGGACPGAVEKCLQTSMDNEFKSMRGRFVEINGVVLKDNIVKRILWAGPNVWQIAADSATLARNVGLESLSKLLLREVSLGHVVRQELASMIPAIMLKVESHHNVLDVCAAPGSKTEQLLCLLNASRPDKNKPATGMVVANDADPIRINTLKKRYARAGSTNLMVTCARAEDLQKMINKPVFDRIVADVPCSGDGTIRKFPHIWRLFRPRMSLELHLVQLQIAIASVLLLKPGGRMVYSTCSINPLEDEAVVSALLRHYWGRLRLVDTKAEGLLPGLITRPGQSYWESSENIFVVGETDDAARKASLARLPKLTHSMKPPTTAEAEIMQLHHCHRILPQDNDTGGFFVAVLEWKPEGEVDSVFTSAAAVSTGNVVYSLGKKQKAIVSAQASVDIMRNLGYNPKHTQNNNTATNPTTTSTNTSTSVVKTKTPAITASSVVDNNANTNSNSTSNTSTATTVVDEIDTNVVYTTLSNAEYSSVTSSLNIDTTTVLPTTTTTTNNTTGPSLYLVQSQVTDTRATEQALLAQAKQREEIAKQGSYSGLFGSKAKGWAKPVAPEGEPVELRPITTTRISLVSTNIHSALTTWAAGAPTYLRQAGVAVADVSKSSSGDSGSSAKVSGGAVSKVPFSTSVDSSDSPDDGTSGNVYSVIPDGAPALVNLISTTSVQNGDFGFVVKYALDAHTTTDTIDPVISTTTATTTTATTTTAINATTTNTTTDVTALFTQIATLSDPEYSADSMVDNINLEEAELQVAVVSGLSGEGLATLALVYQEAVESVRSNCGNGGVVHVLVTGGSASVTSGSASNSNNATNNNNSGEGEKRRLSKAERKKLKTGGNTTTTTAKTTAITTTTTKTDTATITNTKPAVLLFRIASKNGIISVTLVTPTDVLKSYSDAI